MPPSTSFSELAQSIGDGPLALISRVQVDHCGPGCRVTHSVHQLTQARPRTRGQRVAGMAQIMEVDQWQPSGSQRRQPDSLPKVPPQRATFRARDKRRRCAAPGPAIAPASAFGEARPARAGPHAQGK